MLIRVNTLTTTLCRHLQFLRRLRNSYGIYATGTAKRQRQNGNGMVETRH